LVKLQAQITNRMSPSDMPFTFKLTESQRKSVAYYRVVILRLPEFRHTYT
jgi:hypothetical protein